MEKEIKKRRLRNQKKVKSFVAGEILSQAARISRESLEAAETSAKADKEAIVKAEKSVETAKVEAKAGLPIVKKKPTRFGMMLFLSAVGVVVGIAGFIIYFLTMNMMVGAPAVIIGVAGAIFFKYYWDKGGNVITELQSEATKKQVNCLDIYRDIIVFEDWPINGGSKPGGYIQKCLNDGKYYWVNIHEQTKAQAAVFAYEGLKPFELPDQQYYDPTVFAEKILELPAHRRVMRRREKLGGVVKTALLVLAVIIIWILIITTT